MKVILTEDVKNLGEAGSVQEVKNGYARNFLLPRGIAKAATPGMMKVIEQQRTAEVKRVAKAEDENRSLATLIEQQTIRLQVRVGQQGRLYGSITNAQIADQLSTLVGQTIDRRKVDITENIHSVGEYEVPIRLVGKLAPKVKVIVEAEGGEETSVPAMTPTSEASSETSADVPALETVESGPDTVEA